MRHFKPEQLAMLIDHVPSNWRMPVLIGFWHGLRVSEILGLTARDIQHGYIKVKRKKRSLPTLQPFVMHKDKRLSELEGLKELAKLPLDTRLFPVTRFAMNKMMTRLNKRLLDLPKCHPHMLRHTCAHVMLDGGKKDQRGAEISGPQERQQYFDVSCSDGRTSSQRNGRPTMKTEMVTLIHTDLSTNPPTVTRESYPRAHADWIMKVNDDGSPIKDVDELERAHRRYSDECREID